MILDWKLCLEIDAWVTRMMIDWSMLTCPLQVPNPAYSWDCSGHFISSHYSVLNPSQPPSSNKTESTIISGTLKDSFIKNLNKIMIVLMNQRENGHTQTHLKHRALTIMEKTVALSMFFLTLSLYFPSAIFPNSTISSSSSYSRIKLFTEDTNSSILNFSLYLFKLDTQIASLVFNFLMWELKKSTSIALIVESIPPLFLKVISTTFCLLGSLKVQRLPVMLEVNLPRSPYSETIL